MDLAPLRHRDFRLLYIAQFVSLLGTMITYVALPYQMYRLTGSSLSVGLLGLAELASLLTTAFLGGMLADVVDRRRMAIGTDLGLAAGSGTLALLATGMAPAWSLYLVAAWMSGVSGLQRPSIESLSPRLVPHDGWAAARRGLSRCAA
jgi:MFS family permease